jgi:hypothetical protein
MLDDQLLKKKEGSLVVDSLSDLCNSDPGMGSVRFTAIFALQVGNKKFNDKTLLQ